MPLPAFALLAFVALLFAGCGGREPAPRVDPRTVRIEWFGNMAFQVTSSLGIRVLTNPFAPGTTVHPQPTGVRPHVILVSHERSDANYVNITNENPLIFRGSVGVGPNNAAGLQINGIPVHRDGQELDPRGLNVVYTWSMDGIRFCFAGALPRALTPSEVSEIGRVDVLFLPIDQPAGMSHANRRRVVESLRPKLVIPMAHSTASANRWASGYPEVRHTGRSVELSANMLAGGGGPFVLIFSR